MSFTVAAVVAAAAGVTKIALSFEGRKARIAEQKAANKKLAQRKADLEGMDTSNPYANMENAYKNLTVNTQQAEFAAQKMQQQQADLTQSIQQSGAGFNAGNIQALVNAGTEGAQSASASIGQQEATNKRLEAQGQMDVQQKERYGELLSQEAGRDKIKLLTSMEQQRKIAADDARQVAGDQISSGIGDIVGAVSGGYS